MAREPSTLYWDQLQQIQAAVIAVEAGGSYTVGARTYGSGDLDELYLRERLLRYRHAEAMITEGAQAYSIDDVHFSRADLDRIATMIDNLQEQLRRYTRGGMRVRLGTPIAG